MGGCESCALLSSTSQKFESTLLKGEDLFSKGDIQGALKCFSECKQMSSEMNDENLKARVLHDLSVVHTTNNNFDDALTDCKECVDIRERNPAPSIEKASIFDNYGFLLMRCDPPYPEEALSYFNKCIELCRSNKYESLLGTSLANAAEALIVHGDNQDAIAYCDESISILQKNGRDVLLPQLHQCVAYTNLGKLKQAESSGRNAFRTVAKNSHPLKVSLRSRVVAALGKVFLLQGNSAGVIQLWSHCVLQDPHNVEFLKLAFYIFEELGAEIDLSDENLVNLRKDITRSLLAETSDETLLFDAQKAKKRWSKQLKRYQKELAESAKPEEIVLEEGDEEETFPTPSDTDEETVANTSLALKAFVFGDPDETKKKDATKPSVRSPSNIDDRRSIPRINSVASAGERLRRASFVSKADEANNEEEGMFAGKGRRNSELSNNRRKASFIAAEEALKPVPGRHPSLTQSYDEMIQDVEMVTSEIDSVRPSANRLPEDQHRPIPRMNSISSVADRLRRASFVSRTNSQGPSRTHSPTQPTSNSPAPPYHPPPQLTTMHMTSPIQNIAPPHTISPVYTGAPPTQFQPTTVNEQFSPKSEERHHKVHQHHKHPRDQNSQAQAPANHNMMQYPMMMHPMQMPMMYPPQCMYPPAYPMMPPYGYPPAYYPAPPQFYPPPPALFPLPTSYYNPLLPPQPFPQQPQTSPNDAQDTKNEHGKSKKSKKKKEEKATREEHRGLSLGALEEFQSGTPSHPIHESVRKAEEWLRNNNKE